MTPIIVNCPCGASVRAPAEYAGKAVRCPKCKSPLKVPAAEASVPLVGATIVTANVAASQICPICQTELASGESLVGCDNCEQVHHQECWSEIGGCGTYGCESAPKADDNEKSVQAPLSAWGDTKQCPACGEMIKAIALRCRYCDTDFDSVDPKSVADLRRGVRNEQTNQSLKQLAVGIFAVSLFGCLAPLMLIVGLIFVATKREQLAKAGPVFVIMTYAGVGLSGLYSLLILLFVMLEN